MTTKRKPGRPAGALAKTTVESRKAIADFINGNIPHLNHWLMQVARGIPATDREGNIIRDKITDETRWTVKPAPEKSIAAISDLLEYHLPRNQRTEVIQSGSATFDIGAMSPQAMMLANMNPEQIASFLRGETAKLIEGETLEPLPEFLQQLEHDHE
jgi:hypothetical protein